MKSKLVEKEKVVFGGEAQIVCEVCYIGRKEKKVCRIRCHDNDRLLYEVTRG